MPAPASPFAETLMRIHQDEESAYEPQNEVERAICKAVEEFTNEEVQHLWTQATYDHVNMDDGKSVQIDHDYVAQTGKRVEPAGMFLGGTVVGVNYRDGAIALEEIGIWI